MNQNALSNKATHVFKNKGLGKAFNKFSDVVGESMEVGDLIFAKRSFETSAARYMQAKGLKEITPDTVEFAMQEALELTYRDFSKAADAITKLQKKGGVLGKAVAIAQPFVKTPINIARRTFENSPAGLAKTLIYDTVQLKRGKITANKYIDNLSKGFTGSLLSTLGFFLAKGLIPRC